MARITNGENGFFNGLRELLEDLPANPTDGQLSDFATAIRELMEDYAYA